MMIDGVWDHTSMALWMLSGVIAWVAFLAGALAVFLGPRSAAFSTLMSTLASAYLIVNVTFIAFFNSRIDAAIPRPMRSTIVSLLLLSGFLSLIYKGLHGRRKR